MYNLESIKDILAECLIITSKEITMKRGMLALLATLSISALMAGGCANKEVVKTEAPVAAATVKGQPTLETPKPVEKPKPPVMQPQVVEQPKAEARKVEETTQAAPKASATEANLEAAFFDFDKSDLRQDARDVLYKDAEVLLKTQTGVKVRVEGNCDERGSAEYNLALGERRAKAAVQYLITLGVPADRLTTLSYGKEKATNDAKDESVWAKDRRDDIVIVK
jgi:peptidoglycan-associated lipoprotein